MKAEIIKIRRDPSDDGSVILTAVVRKSFDNKAKPQETDFVAPYMEKPGQEKALHEAKQKHAEAVNQWVVDRYACITHNDSIDALRLGEIIIGQVPFAPKSGEKV